MSNWLYQTRPNLPIVSPLKPIRFVDVNPDYGMDTNPLITKEDLAIRKQMKHLLSTLRGSEGFEPTFGSLLPYRLYEPINSITAFLIETDTIVAIATWMSDRVRIILPGVSIVPLVDDDAYSVTIPYVRLIDNQASVYAFDAMRS